MSSPSAFDGAVILEEGQLNINHAGALGDGTFRISDATTVDNTSGTAITVKYNQKTELHGDFTFFGTNDLNLGTGQVALASPQRTVTVAAGRLEFGGSINGSGVGLIQDGAGTLVLSGNAAAHTGLVVATNGAIMANGSILKSTGTAGSGATFGGSGTVGVVTIASGGTLQPGDLALVKSDPAAMDSGTFTGTIGAGYSTLTVDRSLATAQTLVQLEDGAVINFALGKGRTNTNVAVINSSGASLKTIGFDNTVIKITDLAEGAAATGEYTLFTADGTFEETFDGLTVDPLTNEITAGLSVDMPAVYAQPDFGYRLMRDDHGIIFKLYESPTISGFSSMVEVVQGWAYVGAPIVFGGEIDTIGVTGLPPGLSYDPATFVISGTPTVGAGTYAAVISAVNPAATVTGTITFEVKDSVPKPEFTMDPIAVGSSTEEFNYDITAENLPQEFYLISGNPAWMSLVQDPVTKVWRLTGTPDGTGTWEVTLRVVNPSGVTETTITVIIDDSTVAPVITSATSMVWVRGYPLDYQITAENAPAFYGVSGTLPAGLTLNALTGAIAGTPSASGTTTVTMQAINATGTGSSPLTFDIMDSMPDPVITSSSTVNGFLNEAFSYTITATNFVTSTTVTSVLPSWLSYDGLTATLSGTCTGDGTTWAISGSTYPVVVEASNIVGTVTGTINIVIKQYYPIPVITNSGSATCYAGRAYADQIMVASTAGIESYSATNLPSGLAVDPATGAISGAPASTGDYTIILAATTSGGTGTGTIGLRVIPVPPGPFIDSPTTAGGATGQPFTYQITAETPAASYGATGLPPGLALDPATGLISGTPSAAGYYMVEISATDSAGTFVQDVAIALEPAASTIVTYAGALETPGLVDANGTAARFDQPHTAAFGISGTIYVADFANNTVRTIATNGDVSSYVSAGQPSAVATDSQGNVYFASQQTGAIMKVLPLDQTVWPIATGLSNPGGLAIDSSDNVYFTEGGATANVIKKISAADGSITILAGSVGAGGFAEGVGSAAKFNGPSGLAYDHAANTLYVADTLNSLIRSVDLATGAVGTVAGSVGDIHYWDGGDGAARFDSPQGLSIDAAGFLYIADTGNNTIRVCDPKAGFVSTLIGVPQLAGAVDGGGDTALLSAPAGIVVDANGTGDIYVIDSGNSAIRTLVSPPCIVSPLVSSTVRAGRSLTLAGRAWGAPAPSYQWYKDGVAVSGSRGQAHTISIDSAQASDAGVYQVVAFNASGTVNSSMTLAVDTSNGSGGTVVIDGGGGGGGGGAPSVWFLFGLAALALGRWIFNFGRANKH
ncbi:putative Ig domain-containing protein [Ereboglobus luteus]|nr:putative Ig domain-containing protein [Ereboglobus luteus]